MILKNNIWKIFYLLSIVATLFLVTLLYFNYKGIKERYTTQVEYYTQIVAQSIEADFMQKDMLLSVVGESIFKECKSSSKAKTEELFSLILKHNPSLVTLGLADKNGQVLVSSSNVEKKDINLMTNDKTSYDFKRSLSSDHMVVSRTYYFDAINEWIIPLRKAIRDDDGNILGVVIAGIKNSKNSNYLDAFELSKNKIVVILKDLDDKGNLYKLYYSQQNSSQIDLYEKPIKKELLSHVKEIFYSKYKYSIKELRKRPKTISLFINSDQIGDNIVGLNYVKKYKLWISVGGSVQEIKEEFSREVILYITMFILTFIIFFILFKSVAVSEKRKDLELIRQVQHDTLTNLPNRIYMYENIQNYRKLYNNKYFVLYLDLDNFKNINDKFGHIAGDDILIEVANRLNMFFTKDEMIIRQGGDEFIVFANNINRKEIELKIQDLINYISKVYHIGKRDFRIGVSIGIAECPKDAKNIEELLSLADTAMYQAKKIKNSYSFFSEEMRSLNAFRTEVEHELRGAIEARELWMAYQPQINSDETLYGVEALVRWQNKKLGFVAPDKFIYVAEESGLMKELGEFIIQTSLREIKMVQEELSLTFNLSINISVVQLMEADFLPNLLKAIALENFNRSSLTLEITESLSIESLDDVLPILYDIQEHDIKISLDDFGTGYSSLSILRELPIDELKIDKSFIDKILYDESEKNLVDSIINIGKNFHMKTLAEGVESIEQIDELKRSNCDIFQGYYYSKPLSREDLIKFLRKG
ncbi:MAG: EAL domain-containing protein [Sulfurimonas sp.]|uniref:bifunctional diguanylate cyclase/phosphodiesterase n=1 Tax=Sulfurimonas sp. TaxID=2022749 RepID=UPI0025D4B2D5|nr:EAL domain-containing protein [Sulfurimonas sp.]MCK9491205.1 EAL domain-containing protein [Sulfurimonas sp.]